MRVKELKSLLKKLLRYLGISEVGSAVYSELAVSGVPLSVKELSGLTGYSGSRIYSSLSELYDAGLIEKVRMGRSIKYTANINFMSIFEQRRKKLMKNYLKPMLDNSTGLESKSAKRILEYVKSVYEYFEQINKQEYDIQIRD